MACTEYAIKEPKISVIVPCFNQGRYLAEALNSVLSQNYTNWECIIVNDGSTDDTVDIASDFVKKDSRFKYLQKINGGLSSARNAGLNASSGAYVQFLDADDFIHKDKFQSFFCALCIEPACPLFVSNFKIYDDRLKQYSDPYCELDDKISLELLITGWDLTFTIPIHCAIFKKKLLGEFNEILKAKEDWLMWINVFGKIEKYTFINEAHAFYRRHQTNMTSNSHHMERNTLLVYNYIYNMLNSVVLKDKLFARYNEYLLDVINSQQDMIGALRKSSSFRIGNFIVSPFSYIKQFVNGVFKN